MNIDIDQTGKWISSSDNYWQRSNMKMDLYIVLMNIDIDKTKNDR